MRTMSKINNVVFMRQAMFIILTLSFLSSAVFSETKTFIGSEVSGSWHYDGNWYPPGVPTKNDNVIIPEDQICLAFKSVEAQTIENNGTLAGKNMTFHTNQFTNNGSFQPNGLTDVMGDENKLDFTNNGTIQGDHLSIGDYHGQYEREYQEGSFENNGQINLGTSYVWLTNVTNSIGSRIKAQVISITSNRFDNNGELKGSDGVEDDPDGGWIVISSTWVKNNGSLIGGDGYIFGGRGGWVHVYIIGKVENFGIIKSGDGGNQTNAGDLVITADDMFENHGLLEVGEAGYGGFYGLFKILVRGLLTLAEFAKNNTTGSLSKTAADEEYVIYAPDSPVEIYADTILVCTRKSRIQVGAALLSEAKLYFTGNYLKFADIDTSDAIFSMSKIHFNTTKDGVLDFSGVRTADAFATLHGDYSIHCDSIIEPPEGLENIFHLAQPLTWPADTTIINGYISSYFAVADTGDVDTITVSLHNLSMGHQILNYSAHSKLGWAENITSSTGLLEPLESMSFLLPYEIPLDITETTSDTVTLALSIGETFNDTGVVYITCYVPEDSTGVNDRIRTVQPEEYRLNVYPNPFNAQVTINYQLPHPEQVGLKIYNLRGQVVKTLMDNKEYGGNHVGTASWNSQDDAGLMVPSGVYFVRLESQHHWISTKLLLIK